VVTWRQVSIAVPAGGGGSRRPQVLAASDLLLFGTETATFSVHGQQTLRTRSNDMFGWALTFLIIAIIAGIFGFTGVAGTASNIAWILFVVGLVIAVIFALTGRRSRL